MVQSADDPVSIHVKQLEKNRIYPLDLVPRRNLVEKLIELVLVGPPPAPPHITASLEDMVATLCNVDTSNLRVVVLGGGSGLSTVIGGDSRHAGWTVNPFQGMKRLFPNTTAIVCTTDDGGSTGELLKDLPIIALGDIRHVLLSSVSYKILKETYRLSGEESRQTAEILHSLFNVRFSKRPASVNDLLAGCLSLSGLPIKMASELFGLLDSLFADLRLLPLLERPHCLGNLLLAAAIYRGIDKGITVSSADLLAGINWLATLIGVREGAVLPCSTTQAHLRVLYSNGVVVSGENKTVTARRNTAIDRVFVEFVDKPVVPPEVVCAIAEADIIVCAPGSLYTSIIPILQVPGLAQAVRDNEHALKILVANLWIQKGETDLVLEDPRRRFYVSDLINAYHRNIPDGVAGLFEQVMVVGLRDIPGNILQSYAVEEKVPIYVDRGKVWQMGFAPVEARIFSETALKERKVRHDPASLAKAIKIIWAVRDNIPREVKAKLPAAYRIIHSSRKDHQTLDRRRNLFVRHLQNWDLDRKIRNHLEDIFWRHTDIPLDHLNYVNGLLFVNKVQWRRSMQWNNVFSYYDPVDCLIKIREDILGEPSVFECALLIALGQSLLGNYAARKEMRPVEQNGIVLGKVYYLTLEPEETRRCYFSAGELARFLRMVRMNQVDNIQLLYSRLISGAEEFTPPGMLMGLVYAWYLDSRYVSSIEYKMAITRIPMTGLVRKQARMLNRRMDTIDFFRKVVFRHTSPVFDEQLLMVDETP